MNDENIKRIVENLISTFLHAGQVALNLREKGLKKKIKSDNTPVSNGDMEGSRGLGDVYKRQNLTNTPFTICWIFYFISWLII